MTIEHATKSSPKRLSREREHAWGVFSVSIALALLVVWSWIESDINIDRLAASGVRIGDFLSRMVPPDLTVLPVVIEASAETLRIAVLGTVGCIFFSVILGLLAASTITPRFVSMPVTWLLATIRGIPLILVAMLMVGAVGLGPLPGILAIAFHATGMLAKFYAESIEGVDQEPVDALESAGATFLQRMRYGVWPQIAPDVVRDTLFRFEMNLRESLILGVVGAGGIGFYIQMYVRAFQYEKVSTLTIVVVFFVVMIELGNNLIRRFLR